MNTLSQMRLAKDFFLSSLLLEIVAHRCRSTLNRLEPKVLFDLFRCSTLEALPGEFQAGGAKHSPSKIYDYAYQKGTQEPMGNPNKNPGDPKNQIFHDREPIAI